MRKKKRRAPIGLILLIIATVTIFLLAVATSIPSLDIMYFRTDAGSVQWPWAVRGSSGLVVKIHILVVISVWIIASLIPAYGVYRYSKRRILLDELEEKGSARGVSVHPSGTTGTDFFDLGTGVVVTGERRVSTPSFAPEPGFVGPVSTPGSAVEGVASRGFADKSGTGGENAIKVAESEKEVHIIFKTFNDSNEGEWTCEWCDIINNNTSRVCKICGKGVI